MDLGFQAVTQENWKECIAMEVLKEQRDFVASNAYSLVQAQYMVGFLMWGEDEEDHDLGMCRLMIDKKFQKRGYGRAAVIKLMGLVREKYGHVSFYTSFESENTVAGKLYMDLGFAKTGDLIGDEIVLMAQL